MAWVWLLTAGLLEVVWAIGIKYTEGFTRLLPSAVTIAAMIGSIYLLALAVRTIPIGTGYAVWTGIGAVGAVVLGMVLFNEPREDRYQRIATELRASIASADLGAPGTVAVAVQTPGDATSAPLTFTVKPRLTVMKVGTGIGTVTSTPGGVACGSDCTEGYPSGTTVTLTATVAPGSRFRGWSGGGCKGASASCTVKLNADTIVQATFAPR